jgi:hypothetical protein
MLYTHFTAAELDQIIAILKSAGVHFNVSPNQAEETPELELPHRRHFNRNPFFDISIEASEFDKLPTDAIKQLERFNILREVVPEFAFEQEWVSETPRSTPAPASLSGILLLLLLALVIGGFWIDTYIIKVFPGEDKSIRNERILEGSLFK